MKKLALMAALLLMGTVCFAQTKNLPEPNLQRKTLAVMQTFKQRKSVREYSAKQLSDQDLSDLLWAAQGKNREDGKLTSPTAMNRQEIRLYVFTSKNVMLYDPQKHALTQVAEGDHRGIVAAGQDFARLPQCLCSWWQTWTSLAAKVSMHSGWWLLIQAS